ELRARPLQRHRGEASGLVAPRPRRVQPDDDELVRAEERLGRLPAALELAPRGGEARRERGGQVVVSGNRQHRPPEPHQERMRTFVLVAAAPVGEVTGRDDERRRRPLDELGERRLDHRLLAGARVQVGDMNEAGWHSRVRLYTQYRWT